MRRILIPLFLTALLAGCSHRDDLDDPLSELLTLPVLHIDASARCLDYQCRANPTDSETQQIQQEHGLEQLTDSKNAARFLQVEGDWVVWQSNTDTLRGDVWAFNIATRDLYGVRTGPGHSTRPFLDDGRVVFQYASENYTGLLLWNAGSDTVQSLDVGVEGRYWLWDLHGDWVAFGVGMGKAMDELNAGEWVVNIKTGQKHHMYTPPQDSTIQETIEDPGLTDGRAEFVVVRRGEDATSSWLHQVNLTTGEQGVYETPLYAGWVIPGRVRSLLDSSPELLLFEAVNDSFVRSGIDGGMHGGWGLSKFGTNDWVPLERFGPSNTTVRFYSLMTGESKVAVSPHPNYFLFSDPATDGRTAAFTGSTGRSGGIFVKPFEELEDWSG